MRRANLIILSLALPGAACAVQESPDGSRHPPPRAASNASLPARPVGLDLYMPVPADNPLTVEKVALGRRLFFDPVLSRDRRLSCGSCHLPDHAFGDTLPVPRATGRPVGLRNVPPLVNRAWETRLFWDGRVPSLEEQALHPIRSPTELGLPLEEIAPRLRADPGYLRAFRAAFPDEAHPIGPDGVARALAAYVRSLQFGDAPFDRYQAGDPDALTPRARRGARLFFGRAGCAQCHTGPTFTDGQLHNTGVSWGGEDLGRFRVTRRDADRGRFRTPTLRELLRTAPYMHDGSLATLDAVVDFYDGGGSPNPFLSPKIRPLQLSDAEKLELAAFLRALSR